MNCIHCKSENTYFSKKKQLYICEDCNTEFAKEIISTPLRIFLSYSHDQNEELVLTIKADLEKRGHDVWIDKSEIKEGDDWRRSITDGILSSNKVLSFLSKHSTRDPGVCLDEIAISIGAKGGNISTILVESESEVKPPPTIGHIQWLDMHDWKEKRYTDEHNWENWYNEKLQQIIRIIESEENQRFSGEIETLALYLEPISSEGRLAFLLRKGFFGRKWLSEEIEKWRISYNRNSRMFWLFGVPGIGKSAFAAHETHFGKDKIIAAQFIEWDKPDHRDPRRVIKSIAFQLATRLPDYRKYLFTLSELKSIGNKNADELFDYLLTNPLRIVIRGGRERLLILIDALDEAGDASFNPLVEMLARNVQRLPDWVGLVVTSRPESTVLAPLQGLNPFVFDTHSESNLIDIKEFLCVQLKLHLFEVKKPETTIDIILQKSEGVFLYVERFCEEVLNGHLSLKQPDTFPQGLGGIYFQYFKRQFPNIDEYRKNIRPILRVILAALEPLPVLLLQQIFNWNEEEYHDFMLTLGSLFVETIDKKCKVIKPYHKVLVDWISDDKKAGNYYSNLFLGHKILADFGSHQMNLSADNSADYFLRQLPFHFDILHNWEELVSLLCTEDYINSIDSRLPEYKYFFIAVFENALKKVPDLLRIRFWKSHNSCSLLALKAIDKMIDQGEIQIAKDLLSLDSDVISTQEHYKFLIAWNCLVGRLAICDGDRLQSELRFSQALQIARDAGNEEYVAKALLGIGVTIRKFGDSLDDAQEILEKTLAMDFNSFDSNIQERVLLNLAILHICKGHSDEAEICLRKVDNLINTDNNLALRAWFYKYQGFLSILQQDFSKAAENFLQASEIFYNQGQTQEHANCSDLYICVTCKSPLYHTYIQDTINRSKLTRTERHELENTLEDLKKLNLNVIPKENDAKMIAAINLPIFEFIQTLENKYDKGFPLASVE